MSTLPRILTIAGHYLPGYKAGGPVRSVANLIDWLGDEFQFSVLAADRDLGDPAPYPGVRNGEWQDIENARVRYLAPHETSVRSWRRILCGEEHDVLYLNSFFSPSTIRILLLRRLGQIPDWPVVLAPRGQFSRGALAIKSKKKRFYILLAQALSLYRHVVWAATSDTEVHDIEAVFGRSIHREGPRLFVAPNLPPQHPTDTSGDTRRSKRVGSARVVFLSRVSRKKNLYGALKMLAQASGPVSFDIFGAIEDRAYWQDCLELIGSLPAHVQATYRGSVKPERVADTLGGYHLLFLPTWGENFGHAILEALCAGCPVLISDQTPWRGLEEDGAGWEVPLASGELFGDVLNRVIDMDDLRFQRLSQAARKRGLAYVGRPGLVEANRELFRMALRTRRHT